jgi:Holliday junction DNA helicase RuvA
MIEYIKGDIAEITPATVVLDCNGMGYGINISLNTYSAIQNQSNTKLYIYEAIREDAYYSTDSRPSRNGSYFCY